ADPDLHQPRAGLLMQYAGKVLRWLGIALAAVLLLLVAVFGLLQTQLGKGWLEREIARATSSPDFTVVISGLGGFVPFRMTAERIEIADRDGTYLTLRGFGLDISAAEYARRQFSRLRTRRELGLRLEASEPTGLLLDRLL